jgi:ceramide glucosyltransferase
LDVVLTILSLLALALLGWQWAAGARFPLHRRVTPRNRAPALTLLKPVKGCDEQTADCLRSWFVQRYPGPVQMLIGAASADDPVVPIVRKLIAEFPRVNAELVICEPLAGANAKVAKLAILEKKAAHGILVISDADVFAPPDLLENVVRGLENPETGLVNCFYRMASPRNVAMKWEALATNADFWSQVLQNNTLKPMDFALGAVMAVRREVLGRIGGFEALADCLADDYQLGHRVARAGFGVQLSTIVVECRSGILSWRDVWKHQLRWARTIRVCQPVPYFFSILSNASVWPLLLVAFFPSVQMAMLTCVCWLLRILAALDLQRRIEGGAIKLTWAWLVPLKDLLQTAVWLGAFLGNTVEWRGRRMVLRKDGTVVHNEACSRIS